MMLNNNERDKQWLWCQHGQQDVKIIRQMSEQLFLSAAILGVGTCVCVCVWPIWYHGNKKKDTHTDGVMTKLDSSDWYQIRNSYFPNRREELGRRDEHLTRDRSGEDVRKTRERMDGGIKITVKTEGGWGGNGSVGTQCVCVCVCACVVLAGRPWIPRWPLQR